MKVWYFESKRCTERKKFLREDTLRVDLCSQPPCYDYAVGHIEASCITGDDTDMKHRLELFLKEAAKLYGRIVLDGNVESLG